MLLRIDIGEPWDVEPPYLRGRLVRPLSGGYYLFEGDDGNLYTVAARYSGDSVMDVFHKGLVMVGVGKVLDPSSQVMKKLEAGRIEELIRKGKLEYWAIGVLRLHAE